MVSRVELAEMIGEALGRTIEAGEMPFDKWAQVAHMPDGLTKEGMMHMFADYNQYGFPGGNALVLRAILGREPRTMKHYIQELAAS
jgi:hypothetical protein